MKSFAIGSLALISNNNSHPNFILQTPIEGLDSPEYRVNYYDKPGQDGGSVSNMFYGKRGIKLVGIITANNPTDFEAARQALAVACQINRDAYNSPIPTRIAITTLAGNSYFIDAYIDRPIFDYEQPNMSRFMITMTATNSYIQGATSVTSVAIQRASGGGFILPVILPIVSSAGTGGSGTVNNSGNAPVYPIITINGPMTSPYIQNQTTGKFMQLNATIATGDIVTIDMANKTIKLNGSSSLISSKATGSDWWTLSPGDNFITLSTQSSADTGSVVLSYNAAFIGI